MHEPSVLQDFLILMAVVIPMVLLAEKLRFPSLIGFIIAGLLIGPYSLGWVGNPESVQFLAEIGIILLLFSIGLEFSIEKIMKLRNFLFLVGGGQVVLTILLTLAAGWMFSVAFEKALVFGFMISVSSTAIIMKILGQRRELSTPVGKLTLSISLFQDLAIIPMMLLLPVMSGSGPADPVKITGTLLLSLTGIGLILFGARLFVPRLLKLVTRSDNREVFIITIIFIIFFIAWIGYAVGLSLALGAFLAGLIVSESEYSHQVLADIFPMKDALTSLFFVSVGMLLNLSFFTGHYLIVLGMAAGIILFKTGVVAVLTRLLDYPQRIGIAVGLTIAQIGEFSLVIALSAKGFGLLTEVDYQLFLGASVLTMLAAPSLLVNANSIGFWIQKKLKNRSFITMPLRRLSHLVSSEKLEEAPNQKKLSGHVIIIGFGKTGQHLSYVLQETGIPFVISELQHQRFLQARTLGYRVVFGDSATTEILDQLGIHQASVLVVGTGEFYSTLRILKAAKSANASLHILARTRYVDELEKLYDAGADQVIPEEFETSIEIFSRTLRYFHIPRNVIASQIAIIRKERYGTMRGQAVSKETLGQLPYILAATTTESGVILESSPIAGKAIGQSGLTSVAGIHIIAVVRDGKSFSSPDPEFVLEPGDVVVMVGNHAEIDAALGILGTDLIS